MEKNLIKIKMYVTELFIRRNFTILKYHDLHHTESVVEHAYEIAGHYQLSDQDIFCLIAAAWFHDSGHLFNELKEHEQAGADLMAVFLKSFFMDENMIQRISDCIMATKMPSNPETTIEKIICDADTYHFGTKEFIVSDPKVYEEMEARLRVHIDHKIHKSIRLLESHRFFTTYCQDLLDKGKNENINLLRRSIT